MLLFVNQLDMKIIKHSGAVVDYNSEKLKNSLLKSGANQSVVERIINQIESEIKDGFTTKKIYKLAFGLLKKSANAHAARYNLRNAIQMLGPSGFFFEKYIARLFAAENFETKTNITLQGQCISHEIDILIRKNNEISMVECKFHAGRDAVSDVKIPMYILSRFNDLNKFSQAIFSSTDWISSCWIVTNNRFTSDAIDFAECSNLQTLSWNYPKNNNLKTKNDSELLYPITSLTSLSIAEKDKLLVLDIVLVKEIINNSYALDKIGLSPNRIKNVLKEASELCS